MVRVVAGVVWVGLAVLLLLLLVLELEVWVEFLLEPDSELLLLLPLLLEPELFSVFLSFRVLLAGVRQEEGPSHALWYG
jgi:hypothetical protein